MPKELLPVVFDLDDVCWGLNPRATRFVGVPLEKLIEFHVTENELLTDEEKQALWAAYQNPQVFQDIDFYPGFEDMMKLRQFGLDPFIKSNCCGTVIPEIKLPQIQAKLPTMPRDHIILNVVDQVTTLYKEIDESVFAFVDDSPYNIAKSRAQHNIVPMWPLNQTPRAQRLINSRERVFQVKHGNLYTIYALLKRLAKEAWR